MSSLPLLGLLTSVAATTLGLVWLDKHLTKMKNRRRVKALQARQQLEHARMMQRLEDMEAAAEDVDVIPHFLASRPASA